MNSLFSLAVQLFFTSNLPTETGVILNPNNTIVTKNVPPVTWNGRVFDMNLYKNVGIMLAEKGVRGSQADFMFKPKLPVFTCTEFDLSTFPNGLQVTIAEQPGGGRYNFSGLPMCF